LADELKPFSIYDDDEEKKPAPIPKIEPQESSLNLEIEDSPGSQDESQQRAWMDQMGGGGPRMGQIPTGKDPGPKSATREASPFLHGETTEDVAERSKELIRKRRDEGKIHDRRKTASIFDKPIEPDRPMVKAKAKWHPLAHSWRSFWFLFPALAAFGLFYLYPTIKGFQVSLTHFSPLGESVPVGWANYRRAFSDDLFWQTVVNATALTFISIVLGFWPPIFLAIILNELKRGKAVLRVLFLVPFVIPAVPAANLWKWMYDDGYGVFNAVLSRAPGTVPVGWLTDPRWAMISITLMFVWKNTGWFMIIYYAFLQSLPEERYEAAELDGAGIWKKIRHITLPHLAPAMGMLLILQVLSAFQVFTEVYVMTNGGPMQSTEVIGTYIYKTAFGQMDLGYAAAMGMLMFAALFTFSAVRLVQTKKTEA